MALSNHDQARIREYLLGHLSDEEQQRIEERLMTEDDLFEELEISKGELIEEYCAGELNQNEHDWFEGHYLASAEGKQRYTFALALNCFKPPLPEPRRRSLFERLVSFFKTQPWVIATVAAAAFVIAIAVGWQQFSHTALQRSFAINLTNSALSRSAGDEDPLPAKVTLPPDTSELTASLTLPKMFAAGTRFRALLDNRSEKKPVNVAEHKDNVVKVVIPATEIPHGEYALELTAIMVDGREEAIRGDYRFDVE